MSRLSKNNSRAARRDRRRARVRSRISGTLSRPRLNVHRSLLGMYAQLIDDTQGKTLVSVHSKKDIDMSIDCGDRTGKVKNAFILGVVLAKKAQAANIQEVVFDRAGYAYQGRVQAFAEGAREGGLQF